MKKVTKLLGIALVLSAILVASIAGIALAASNNPGTGNQGEECPYGTCTSGDCVPNNYSHNYDYNYLTPGPHGAQKDKI